jgi:hypothetical protein
MILVRQTVVTLKQRIFRFDPMPGLVVFVVDKVCVFVCSTGCVWAMYRTRNLFYLHVYLATNANSVTTPHHLSITVRVKCFPPPDSRICPLRTKIPPLL